MGQSPSRHSSSPPSLHHDAGPVPTAPRRSRRESLRQGILNLVKPASARKSWRNSRRWSKAPVVDPPLSSSPSSSPSSSSTALPLPPVVEKGKQPQHDPTDSDLSSVTAPTASSSTSPDVSETTIVEPVLDDVVDEQLVASPELPAVPEPSLPTLAPIPEIPAQQQPQHQFPPPGTLVVVQGVVHTTDVPRPTPPVSDAPPSDAPARPASTPPASRNRLSTLLHSRPSSTVGVSSTTLDTTPPTEDPVAPLTDVATTDSSSGVISSGSIDVLGTLLSVAAAATAASLLTGTSEPLLLPSNLAASPTAVPSNALIPLAERPTSPTPTSSANTLDNRSDRFRHAWGSIRERLGLRPAPLARTPNTSNTLTATASDDTDPTPESTDPREQLFGQMARAFNLGLGLATESAASVSGSMGAAEGGAGANNGEPPAEGSFERFLMDLQTDLRTALTTGTAVPAVVGQEQVSTEVPVSSADDDDDDSSMPPLGDVSDSDEDTDFEDAQEELDSDEDEEGDVPESAPVNIVAGSNSTPAQGATASMPDVDAQGRINWWRLYRFAPIALPPNHVHAHGLAMPVVSPPPPEPIDSTLSELPFADNEPQSPPPIQPSRALSVVPVIVVGVQSVSPAGEEADEVAEETPVDDGTGPHPHTQTQGATTTEQRPRGWHMRAAEAIRSLRPGGRRDRNVTPTAGPGSRTFLIYVIGGYYPPNHTILNGGPDTLASLEALLELADLLGHTKPPTVTKEDIDKSGLEIIKSSQLAQYEKEEKISSNCTERCLICLDDYSQEDDIRVMKCRHAFHQNCVDKWLETGRNNCPACRSKGVNVDDV